MTVALFLLAALQIMIFGFFQISDELLGPQFAGKIIPLNIFFYSLMVVTAVFHPTIMRRFTLKFALLAGLLCDMLGLALFMAK